MLQIPKQPTDAELDNDPYWCVIEEGRIRDLASQAWQDGWDRCIKADGSPLLAGKAAHKSESCFYAGHLGVEVEEVLPLSRLQICFIVRQRLLERGPID